MAVSRALPSASEDWLDDTTHVPEPGFERRRTSLLAMLVAAIVLPFLYVTVMAINDFHTREATARDMAMRTARAAEEHALKVFDLSETLDARIADLVRGLDDDAVRKREADIHETLQSIGGGYPQVAVVSIFGPDGRVLANSLYYPVPHGSIANRDDFIGIRAGHMLEHVSRVRPGPRALGRTPVFSTGVARVGPDGGFGGLVSIALKTTYFDDFYRDLLGTDTPMGLMLTRSDGALLAAYPPDTSLPPEVAAALAAAPAGAARTMRVGHGTHAEIIAYRQVGTYPVWIACAYPRSAIWHDWYKHLSILVLSIFVPSLALWCLIALTLRRLKAEEDAWGRWRAEASMRRSLEIAYRHARKMESLGNLVGSVAHDFNNLLMIISSHVQIMRRLNQTALEPDLAAIERALKNGESLTRQLLGVARKQPLRRETVDLAAWFAACGESLRALLGERARLDVQLPAELWPICVDAAELELAVINLAVNARDAMPLAGVLRISGSNLHLASRDGFALTGDFVRITVEDNGLGMTPEVLSRAFEPLFTTKPPGSGTGLGLPQVCAFCERSGGLATIDSTSGAGTSVNLYLPRAAKADPAQAAAPAGLDILLVEDDLEVAAGTEMLLRLLGHRIRHVPSADQAIQVLRETVHAEAESGDRFDLVISDITMPGALNGIDLAEILGRSPFHLPVILVTGYAEEIDRMAGTSVSVLSKPFDIGQLEQMLGELRSARKTHPKEPTP